MLAINTYHGDASDRYLKVRIAFMSKGSSLHAWCRGAGVPMPNARAALLGEWNGPKARALVERIVREAGGVPE